MKTLFVLVILAICSSSALAAPYIPDYAVEGYPGSDNVINGRYQHHATYSSGHHEFRSSRTDGVFLAPLSISWNSLAARWEIRVGKLVSGSLTRVVVATSYTRGITPPVKGWYVYYPYGNPLGLSTPLKVYQTETQNSLCDCSWSNAAMWSSGFVPREYDNVVINHRVNLDVPGLCNNLKINSVTFPAAGNRLFGSGLDAVIKMNGNLDTGGSATIDIFSIEFTGNSQQTLKVDTERGFGIKMSRAIINNNWGIKLLSAYGFLARAGAGRCETRFVKGKIILGNYILSCQTITGYNAQRFVVTNGSGYLFIEGNTAGTRYDTYFPIGSSESSYTPLRIFCTSSAWTASLMARAKFDPTLFPSTPHVNVIYQTESLVVRPGSDTPLWVHQAYWYATDESTGFNRAAGVRVDRLTDTGWARTGSEGVPTGTGPYMYTYNASTWEDFGIFQATSSSRIAAESISNVQEVNDEIQTGVFPNPASQSGFKVKVNNANEVKIQLIAISGANLAFSVQKESSNIVSIQPHETMTPGVYILQIQENNSVRTHKVMIK